MANFFFLFISKEHIFKEVRKIDNTKRVQEKDIPVKAI